MTGLTRAVASRAIQPSSSSLNQVFNSFKRFLLITTEATPNPATMKFKPVGKTIVDSEEGYDFRSILAAKRSPLAKKLLAIDGVSGVFIGKDFIAVTKKGEGDESDVRWQQLKVFIFSTQNINFAGSSCPFASISHLAPASPIHKTTNPSILHCQGWSCSTPIGIMKVPTSVFIRVNPWLDLVSPVYSQTSFFNELPLPICDPMLF